MTTKKPTPTQTLSEQLLKFQIECPTIEKTTEGHGYKYAPLPHVMQEILPRLNALGITLHQSIEGEIKDETLHIRTILQYGEESQRSFCPVLPCFDGYTKTRGAFKKKDMMEVGKAITYARRYSIALALGLVFDEDTDSDVRRIPKWQFQQLSDELDKLEKRDKVVIKILDTYKIEHLENLPTGMFTDAMERVHKLIKKQGEQHDTGNSTVQPHPKPADGGTSGNGGVPPQDPPYPHPYKTS